MDNTERDRLSKECSRASALLEEILPPLFTWSVKDPALEKGLAAAVRKAGGKDVRFPPEWIKATAPQLAAASVLGDAGRIDRFASAHERRLSADSLDFLRRLAGRPAFFTAFAAETSLEDDLFEIRDHSSGDRFVLFSTTLGELYRMQARSYLTLLVDNGSCLQSIGPLHYYLGFEGVDFHYYARLLRPQAYGAAGLSAVMTNVPEWFVVLDVNAQAPPISHEGTLLYCCWSSVGVDAFDPSPLDSVFDVTEARGVHRCRLKGSSPPFDLADLYWDSRKRKVLVYTKGVPSYTRIALAVAGQVALPPEPQWRCTQNMEVAAHRVLGRDPPVFFYERLFQGPDPGQQQKGERDKINALIRELNDARDQGLAVSVDEAAARRGIPPETAQEVKRLFERVDRQYGIELEGGLAGIPRLPSAQVQGMKRKLAAMDMFRFSAGGEAVRLFPEVSRRVEALRGTARVPRAAKPLSLQTLPDVLEEIADREWRDPNNFVLKYTLYLLCLKGGELESTWDYAAEVLRLLWQAVLQSRERMHVRRFTRQYSVWCREFLVRSGLTEEESAGGAEAGAAAPHGAGTSEPVSLGGPLRMRASAFLKAWLSLAPTPKGKSR